MTGKVGAARLDPSELKALRSLDFRARYLVEGYMSGIHQSPFHGSSVEFSEYRAYQPGDDLRRVDWRLYARVDRLYLKRYEHETEARCYLVCDASASMSYCGTRAWASKAVHSQTIAAAMAWLLLKQKDPVGLAAFSESPDGRQLTYLAPSRQSSQLGQLLSHLNGIGVGGGAQLPALLEDCLRIIRRRSIILLFSDLLEPSAALERILKRLRFHGHEVIVFQTLDPDELDFPFADSGIFLDPETGVRRQVSPSKARSHYLERFGAFMKAHEEMFASLEISHRLFRTDENPGPALAQFLSARLVK
jgi:uncharacterized protein (DUF58 family)